MTSFFFFGLKLCIIYNLIDNMLNNIWLTQNLTCVLKACRTCNLTIKSSKYVITFILLSKIVVLDYNKFYN